MVTYGDHQYLNVSVLPFVSNKFEVKMQEEIYERMEKDRKDSLRGFAYFAYSLGKGYLAMHLDDSSSLIGSYLTISSLVEVYRFLDVHPITQQIRGYISTNRNKKSSEKSWLPLELLIFRKEDKK